MSSPAMAYDEARGCTVLLGFHEAWTWDGFNWQSIAAPSFGFFSGPVAMCYDSARQVVVAVIPFWIPRPPRSWEETWEWDGASWRQRAVNSLLGGGSFRVTFDSRRNRTVMIDEVGGCSEWDGNTWHLAPRGPRLGFHHVAYDPQRGRMLVFGDTGATAPAPQTWEWDGLNWAQASPPAQPNPLFVRLLQWLPSRGRCVAFAGNGDELHEWTGTTWQVTPQRDLLLAFGAAVTDQQRGRVIAVGNNWQDERSPYRLTTAEWDGLRWRDVSPAFAPSGRVGYGLAFDAARGRVVMFGGYDHASGNRLVETWEWDRTQWQQMQPVQSPPPRGSCALAYDDARQRTVLFGGSGNNNALLGDTWEWDGSNWTALTPAVSPPARSGHAMAFDPGRRRIVLFGGSAGSTNLLADTWEWDGAQWRQLAVSGPSARTDHQMAYDPQRGAVLMFGCCWQLGDRTWSFDGVAWTQVISSREPVARMSSLFAYDPVRRRMLMHAGEWFDDQWFLGHTASASDPYGTGCAIAELVGKGVATPGAAIGYELRSGRAAVPAALILATAPASVDLGGGCRLLVNNPFAVLALVTSAHGDAALALQVPPMLALRGLSILAQAAVVDPSSAALGLAWTGGWRFVIGD